MIRCRDRLSDRRSISGRWFVLCVVGLLVVRAPASATSCDVVDRAPLVFADTRPCLPADTEDAFLKSTGGTPWVAHLAHGYACLGQGHYRIAASEFAASHRAYPRDVRTVMYEAVVYDHLGDGARVAALVALARRIAAESRPPMQSDTAPGATQLLHGHYAKAFAYWRYFADEPYNEPQYNDAHAIQPYHHGLDLAVRGDYCGALRVLAPVVAGTASFGDIRFIMGAAYYALGNRAQARYEFEAAAIQTPPQPDFWVATSIQWTALNLLVQMPR